jgi:hydroxymethylpyrimidine pyrophosphatase-like HAD family hydrolase
MTADARCCYIDLDSTLLGFGGSILHTGDDRLTDAGVRALEALHAAAVPFVFVSGRSRLRLETIGRLLGAHSVLAELGALEAGYPTAPGQTVLEAISATGIIDALLAREAQLEIHPGAIWGREGSHCLRGIASADTAQWVAEYSGRALRFADNGRIGPGEVHVFHVLPAAASKAAAVQAHLARYGFDPAACLAVGDSAEDLAISAHVGAFALVRNGAQADHAVGARARWITRGANGAGVLEAVTAWLTGAAPAPPGPPH